MGTTTALMTFEEFERIPDEEFEAWQLELLDGELIRLPPPKIRHVEIAKRLFNMLMKTPLAGDAYIEMGYKIGRRSWLSPDVSVVRPEQPRGEYLEQAPLLAIEIISESNSAEFMDRKVKKYLANGGVEVWLVYPRTRCVWVFREGHAQEFRGSLESAIIPGLKIDLEQLFA